MAKFSRDIILPSLPAIAISLSASQTAIQYSVPLYFLGLALSRFILSPLSDIYGRRRAILWSLPIFLMGTLCCAMAHNFWFYLTGRCIQALGIGCVTAIGRAIINDLYHTKDTVKALTVLSFFAIWAPALATLVGGYVQIHFGWRTNFIFLLIMGLGLYGQCFWGLPETSPSTEKPNKVIHQIIGNYKLVLSNHSYYHYLFAYAFMSSGTVAYFTASPFIFISTMHISPHTYGYFAFFTIGGMLLGKVISIPLSNKWGIEFTLKIGLLMGVGISVIMLIVALLYPPSITNIMIPVMIYFICMGLLSPTSKASVMALTPRLAGTASAILGLAQGLTSTGAGLATAILGLAQGLTSTAAGLATAHLHERNAIPMAGIMIVVSSLATACFFIIKSDNTPLTD